jgi:phosphoglucosamine mutase
VLDALRRSGRSLGEAVAGMRKVAQTTVNVRVAGGAAALVADTGVQRVYERVRAELEGKGRVVLRPSGTEPLVRVTIEAGDGTLVERLAAELADAVRSAAARTNPTP